MTGMEGLLGGEGMDFSNLSDTDREALGLSEEDFEKLKAGDFSALGDLGGMNMGMLGLDGAGLGLGADQIAALGIGADGGYAQPEWTPEQIAQYQAQYQAQQQAQYDQQQQAYNAALQAQQQYAP